MRIIEKKCTFTVRDHGSEYVKPCDPVYLCPECLSDMCRKTKDVEHKWGDYVCDNCGCSFDVDTEETYTTFGKVMSVVLLALFWIFILAAGITFIYGVIYGCMHDPGNGGMKPEDLIKALLITFGGTGAWCLFVYLVHRIKEKYFWR